MYERYEFLNQTQLGTVFGVSSHVIGKWLKQIGLRNPDGSPTYRAFDESYCEKAENGRGGYYYVWHRKRTIAALEGAGQKQIVQAKQAPVVPGDRGLKGPFELCATGTNSFEIVNSENEAIFRLDNKDAPLLVKLLTLAHKHGVVA